MSFDTLSKEELIKSVEQGWFKDGFVYNPSAFDAIVLIYVETDAEFVFGFYEYNEEREYFKTELYTKETEVFDECGFYFELHGKEYNLDEFMLVFDVV